MSHHGQHHHSDQQHHGEDKRLLKLRESFARLDIPNQKDFVKWALRDIFERERQTGDDQPVAVGTAKIDIQSGIETMNRIAETLRGRLPLTAIADDERITLPSDSEEFADATEDNTVHVDAFLYPDELVDDLCDEGKMSRAYCLECGSKNTKMLTFVSHSMSHEGIRSLYVDMLPDLTGKHVVDVGSRLGIVLFGAQVYSNAARATGIELSASLCGVQEKLIGEYSVKGRAALSVVCANVLDCATLLASADVVVLNNVFQFFASREEQLRLWMFLRATLTRPGCIIVSVPSLREALDTAQVESLVLDEWVECIGGSEGGEGEVEEENDEDEDGDDIHVYLVR